MKKSIRRVSAIALSTLMAVSAIGGVTASAAETTTQHEYRTIYFVNNKGWKDVYAYMWDAPDMMRDAKGNVTVEDKSGQPLVRNANFPGQKVERAGITYDAEGHPVDVYSVTVDMSMYDAVVFSSPSTDRQQSKDILLKGTASNCFCLDANNYASPIKGFNATDVKQRALQSDGSHKITVDTTKYNNAEPKVNFLTTGGRSLSASKVEKISEGKYAVTIPAGTFIQANVYVNNTNFTAVLNETVSAI